MSTQHTNYKRYDAVNIKKLLVLKAYTTVCDCKPKYKQYKHSNTVREVKSNLVALTWVFHW